MTNLKQLRVMIYPDRECDMYWTFETRVDVGDYHIATVHNIIKTGTLSKLDLMFALARREVLKQLGIDPDNPTTIKL